MVLGSCPRAGWQHLLSPAFTQRLQSSKPYRDSHLHAQKIGTHYRQDAGSLPPACITGAPEGPRGGQVSPLAGCCREETTPAATVRLPWALEAAPAAPRRVQGGVRREQVVS